MALTVKLFQAFDKKQNSTKLPTGVDPKFTRTESVLLKSGTSMLSPVLEFHFKNQLNPAPYNYCWIPDFKRFYWVNDWTYDAGFWYAALSVDALATWKGFIQSMKPYVLRSATKKNDKITDNIYPTTNKQTLRTLQKPSPWITESEMDADGVYVLGVAGKTTRYFVFPSGSNVIEFFNALFSDNYLESLYGDVDWATAYPQLRAEANPLQYITSLKWFPTEFSRPASWTQVSRIPVGWVDVLVKLAWAVGDTGIVRKSLTWNPPRHPLAATRGSYLNGAPFSHYKVNIPPFGVFDLDPDLVANSNEIFADIAIDLRTGTATLTLSAGNGNMVIARANAVVAMDVQVTNIQNTNGGLTPVLSGVAGATGAAFAGPVPDIGGIVNSASGAIAAALSMTIPTATTFGSSGGIGSLVGLPAMEGFFSDIVAEDKARYGSPLCEVHPLADLTGYTVCNNVNPDFPGITPSEVSTIKSYMEGGFYIE